MIDFGSRTEADAERVDRAVHGGDVDPRDERPTLSDLADVMGPREAYAAARRAQVGGGRR